MTRTSVAPLVGLLVLAAAVAVPMHGASADSPAAHQALVRPASLAPVVPHDAVPLGRLDPGQPVTFDVTLAPSHAAELASLMRALYDPSSARYQQWLAPGEFARRFGPDPADVHAVVGWLHGVGFHNTRVVDGRVEVHATARTAASALGVAFARYESADGTESFSPNAAPLVPRTIAPVITSIVGLSEAAHLQPHLRMLTAPESIRVAAPHAQSCASSVTNQANSLGGWTTRQIGRKYQVAPLLSAGLNGAGKTIAVFELAPHTPADTSAYLACFGLHNSIATRLINGGALNNSPVGTVEANLDIEAAAAIAPGAKVISYEGPNTELGDIRVWQAIVNEDKAQVVSTSWGVCEMFESANERSALHSAFTQAAAQGQTIFAAAGDSGSEDCLSASGSAALAVDSPANEPLVTGVGGTSMKPNGAITNPSHEPVWNDCEGTTGFNCAFNGGGGAGGGGLSQLYAKPSWQPAASASPCNPGCREVPDLAANSGIGEVFLSNGMWNLIGGTSIASPKLAGIAADIVKGCLSPLGPFNRKVYALARAGGIYGSALRDVPTDQGDNDLTRNHENRYSSGSGFDLATGMGTPLASGLVCPEVARVTPATAAAGARVKVTGLGLSRATVRFGNTAAKVVSRSTTSVTVVVPKGSGTVQVRASGPMGRGTLHASFAY